MGPFDGMMDATELNRPPIPIQSTGRLLVYNKTIVLHDDTIYVIQFFIRIFSILPRYTHFQRNT